MKQRTRSIALITTVDLDAMNGPPIHVLNVVNGLSRRGWNVNLVAPRPAEAFVVALDSDVVVTYLPRTRTLGLPGGIAAVLTPWQIWRLRHVDVVYVRSAPASIFASAAAAAFSNGPLVVEFNGWISDEAKILGSNRLVMKMVGISQGIEARLADRIRVVTQPLKARAIAAGAAPERVHVIPAGTDLDIFKPLERAQCRQLLRLPPEPLMAVFLGNLWPAIDIATMIQGIRRLRRGGLAIELLIVGTGVDQSRLDALLAQETGLDGAVRQFGALSPEDANVVLGAADVALAPFVRARNETIGLAPMKIRDYAAAGKRTVASTFRGIAELADEPWLFLTEPENADCLASAVVKALAADSIQTRDAARACAERVFGWGSIVEQIDTMITGQLSNRNAVESA